MSNELYHYGVKGMKWGVHKAISDLNSAHSNGGVDRGLHNNAIAKLDSHKNKINKKLNKLDKQHSKLSEKSNKLSEAAAYKKSLYDTKASKHLAKSTDLLSYVVPFRRYIEGSMATSNNAKSKKVVSQAELAKQKVLNNEKLQEEFKKGLSEIDKATVNKGMNFLYMRSNGMPYTTADYDSWTDKIK